MLSPVTIHPNLFAASYIHNLHSEQIHIFVKFT